MFKIDAQSTLSGTMAVLAFSAVMVTYSFVVRNLILTEPRDDQPVLVSCFSDGRVYVDESVEKWLEQNQFTEAQYYEAVYRGTLSCDEMIGWTQVFRPANDFLGLFASEPGAAAALLLAAFTASQTAKLAKRLLH